MLLGKKCKLSIFQICLCSLILEYLIFIHNNSLEWIFMILFHLFPQLRNKTLSKYKYFRTHGAKLDFNFRI